MTYEQKQRKVGVGVKEALPSLATQVQDVVVDMRRRLPTMTTAAALKAMTRDTATFRSSLSHNETQIRVTVGSDSCK